MKIYIRFFCCSIKNIKDTMTAIQIVMTIVTEQDQAIPTVMKQDIQTITVEMVTIIGTQCMKPV